MYFGKKIEKIEQEHIIPLQSEINKTLYVFFLGICCCCYCCECWDCVLYATFSVFSNIVYIFCWLVINFHGALLIALLCKKNWTTENSERNEKKWIPQFLVVILEMNTHSYTLTFKKTLVSSFNSFSFFLNTEFHFANNYILQGNWGMNE